MQLLSRRFTGAQIGRCACKLAAEMVADQLRQHTALAHYDTNKAVNGSWRFKQDAD